MNRTDTKILVCCHTNDIYKSDEQYFPIHVGKEISDKTIDIQGDNTGDNISDKNKSFCELTGMYWAWKNLKNVDYVGLCHYRRYFKTIITEDNVDDLMHGYDIMLVKKMFLMI